MKKKTIPVRFIVDALMERNTSTVVLSPNDLTMAVKALMSAAHKVFFLSIPNQRNIDYVNEAISMLSDQFYVNYDSEWYANVYRICIDILTEYFQPWDDVTFKDRDNVFFFRNHGDFRINLYHATYGTARVGSDVDVKAVDKVDDITDQFYVSDFCPIELSEDAFNVTTKDDRWRSSLQCDLQLDRNERRPTEYCTRSSDGPVRTIHRTD